MVAVGAKEAAPVQCSTRALAFSAGVGACTGLVLILPLLAQRLHLAALAHCSAGRSLKPRAVSVCALVLVLILIKGEIHQKSQKWTTR